MHIGRKNILGIGLQRDDTPVAPTHYIPFLECNLIERHTPIPDIQAKGTRELEGGQSVEGKKWGEGNIEVVLDPVTAPYWFALALGEIESSPFGELYQHDISRASNTPLKATIWRDRYVDKIQFSSAVVDNLELAFADDVAKLTVDIFSKFPTSQDRTPEMTELSYYTFRNATVEIDESTPIKVREMILKIENNAELIFAPGNNNVDRIAWKGFRVSGKFTLLFEDTVQKTAFHELSKQSLKIKFEGEAGDEITIQIPQFRVDNWGLDNPNDDLVNENIEFVAELAKDAEESISVRIVNDVPDYISES